MPIPYSRDERAILESGNRLLRSNGRITNLEPGGIAFTLNEIAASNVAGLHRSINSGFAMAYVDTAAGEYLDYLGDMFGLRRQSSTAAVVDEESRSIRFYTSDNQPLATYLPSRTIPIGTRITTSDGSIVYTVVREKTFDANATSAYVAAAATTTGVGGNVGPNMLVSHNLGDPNVLVRNDRQITTGEDVESDDRYRYRLSQQARISASANIGALKAAALATPGVADVLIRPYAYGVGTVEVFLIPSGTTIPPTSLIIAAQLVEEVRGAGTAVVVRAPAYAPVQLKFELIFTKDTPDAERVRIRARVPQAVIDYLEEISLGGLLVINEIRQRVMGVDDRILDMSITCFVIRKRVQLLRNFRLQDDELFIPDPDVDQPIRAV